MPLALTETIAPAEEPVSLDEAKAWMKLEITAADDVITRLIKAARGKYERDTRLQLVNATYTLKLDFFPTGSGVIELPRPPLSSVSSIQYVDETGTTQTLAASKYQTDTDSRPGRVKPDVDEVTWPATEIGTINAVTITFVAGYGDAADVPERHKMAIETLILFLFESPEAATEKKMHMNPLAYDSFVSAERQVSFR